MGTASFGAAPMTRHVCGVVKTDDRMGATRHGRGDQDGTGGPEQPRPLNGHRELAAAGGALLPGQHWTSLLQAGGGAEMDRSQGEIQVM